MLLSISDKYIIEKNLNGRVIETIDLKTVISATVLTEEKMIQESSNTSSPTDGPKLKPMFTIGSLAQSVDEVEAFENIPKSIEENKTYFVCLFTRNMRKNLRERKYKMEDQEHATVRKVAVVSYHRILVYFFYQ